MRWKAVYLERGKHGLEGRLRKPTVATQQGGVSLPYPSTVAMGDVEEMRRAGQLLDEVKESIINAYELKTGLSRTRISHMMNDETWMNPVKARELGFCDEILFSENEPQETGESMFFSSASVQQRVMNSLLKKVQAEKPTLSADQPEQRTSASALADRLDRLKYDY